MKGKKAPDSHEMSVLRRVTSPLEALEWLNVLKGLLEPFFPVEWKFRITVLIEEIRKCGCGGEALPPDLFIKLYG